MAHSDKPECAIRQTCLYPRSILVNLIWDILLFPLIKFRFLNDSFVFFDT